MDVVNLTLKLINLWTTQQFYFSATKPVLQIGACPSTSVNSTSTVLSQNCFAGQIPVGLNFIVGNPDSPGEILQCHETLETPYTIICSVNSSLYFEMLNIVEQYLSQADEVSMLNR